MLQLLKIVSLLTSLQTSLGSLMKKKEVGFLCSCYVRFPLEVFYCLLVATCKGGNLSSTVFFNFLFIIYAVHFSLIYQQTV